MNINMYTVHEHVHAHVHLHVQPKHKHEPVHVQRMIICAFSHAVHLYVHTTQSTRIFTC